MIAFFRFDGVIKAEKDVIKKKVESNLERIISGIARWEKPDFFFKSLLNEFWDKYSLQNLPKSEILRIKRKIERRFPGVFEFIFLDKNGEVISELSVMDTRKELLKNFFRDLEIAQSGNLKPIQKDWYSFSGLIGPLHNPCHDHVDFNEIRRGFLRDKRAYVYFTRPSQNGMFLAFLNRVPDWDLLGLKDSLRRFNLRNKFSRAFLFDPSSGNFPGIDSNDASDTAGKLKSWLANGLKETLWIEKKTMIQRFLGSGLRLVVEMNLPREVLSERNRVLLIFIEFLIFMFSFIPFWLVHQGKLTFKFNVKIKLFFLFLFTIVVPISVILLSTQAFLMEFRKVIESEIAGEMEATLNSFETKMHRIFGEVQSELTHKINKPFEENLSFQENAIRRMETLIKIISPTSAWMIDEKGAIIAESRMKLKPDTKLAYKFAKGAYIEIFNKLNDSIISTENKAQSYITEFSKAFGMDAQAFLNGIVTGVGKIKEVRFGDKRHFQGTFPIRDKSGKTIFLALFGFERNNLSWKYIQRYLPILSRQLNHTRLLAVSPSNIEFRMPKNSVFWKKLEIARKKFSVQKRLINFRFSQPGKKILVTGVWGEKLNFHLFSLTADEEIQEEERKVTWYLNLYLLGMLLIIGTVSTLLSQKVVHPLINISRGLEAIKARNFRHRIPNDDSDEFGALIRSFNEMMEGLSDLEVARIVQESLFPNGEEKIPGLVVFGSCQSAVQVGGDYFDYFILSPRKMAVIIGDVSGHGISAAIVMSLAKGLFSHPANEADPARILDLLNLVLWKCLKRKKLMTCWAGIIDLEANKLIASNGGHHEAYLVRSGNCLPLSFKGPVIGIGPRGTHKNEELGILPGDTIIQYSDGLIEAITYDESVVGFERFTGILPSLIRETPRKTEKAIREWHEKIVKPGPPADDITVLVLQFPPILENGK
ncbi:SpoIIE family protein phosphatase [bacterium]|nr:SpoIIE family protein phosphatase [bacterium]